MDSPYRRSYLLGALDAAPELFDHLLEGLSDAEADRRPDPDRFTIREALAHLADWEDIFRERMRRTRDEDTPTLPGYDEGEVAREGNYDARDWREQARLFRERRAQMSALLESLTPEQWRRTADRPEIGTLTLADMAHLVALHDTYHLRQIAAYRRGFEGGTA
jgi:uncharacterized damage-inducible protein DinB